MEHSNNADGKFQDLTKFKLAELLNDDPIHKCAFVRATVNGEDGQEKDAVVILDKKAFAKEDLSSIFGGDKGKLISLAQNDIYGNYELQVSPEFNVIKSTVIFPATQKHIDKYRQQEPYLIRETANDYFNYTLPVLENTQFSLTWVKNCLEKKAEVDRLLFEDCDPECGFQLYPDLKWDGKTTENLYVTGICFKNGIKSIRDLNATHLPLLRNMLNKGMEIIKEKYGVGPMQLRVYVHYQPSYYHFHVHYTHLKFEAPGSSVTKAHLLSELIDNIEENGDYYKQKTLYYVVKESDPLYAVYKEAKHKNGSA